jgi:disulfide bond formation protein DsbB
MTFQDFVINSFSILTIFGTIILGIYIIDLIFYKLTRQTLFSKLWAYIEKNSLSLILLVSVLATGGSLLFSEVLNFNPCKLCWFQRIFMYPQVLLAGLAVIKNEKKILPYLLILSIIGAAIAGFHYYNQVADVAPLPCSSIGYSSSCSEFFFLTYGYVTIPMMALIAFLLIIMIYTITRISFRH